MKKYFIGIKLNGPLLHFTKALHGTLTKMGAYDLGKKCEPHVTIIPPFPIVDRFPLTSSSIYNELIVELERFAHYSELPRLPNCFSIMGVGHFGDQVIYLDPESDFGITRLYSELSERFYQVASLFARSLPEQSLFIPHITLWRREDQHPDNPWCGHQSFRHLYESIAEQVSAQSGKVLFSEVNSFSLFSKGKKEWEEEHTFSLEK